MPGVIEFQIGEHKYRLDAGELTRDGEPATVPGAGKGGTAKSRVSVLARRVIWEIASRGGAAVTKDELKKALWPERTGVRDNDLTHYIAEARRVLGDPKVIVMMDGMLRFTVPVTIDGVKGGTDAVMPPPKPLRGMTLYPADFPESIGDRFVGRVDELRRVHETLAENKTGALTAGALVHSGGAGKTRLATEYVWRYGRDHYPGGVVWIDAAAEGEALERQHHGILRLYCKDTPELPVCREQKWDIGKRLGEYFQQRTEDRPVLAVVDNFPEPEGDAHARPLAHYCPGAAHVTVLVTSRVRLPGVRGIAMGELALDAAVEMLTVELASAGDLTREQWEQVAEWVGRLPLVLELLNMGMRETTLAPRDVYALAVSKAPMTAELDAVRNRLRSVVSEKALRGVTMAFDAAYQRLKPAVQRAARVAAHWDAAAIPVDLVRGAEMEEAAEVLVQQSWIQGAPEAAMLGTMHRVIADFLRSRSEAEGVQGRDAEAAVGAVRRAWPRDTSDPTTWEAARRLQGHGLAAVGYAESRSVGEGDCWWVLDDLATLARHEGALTVARELGERATDFAREKLGAEHPDTLTSMDNLALTMWAQGDLAGARAMEEEVLAVRRRVLGAEHPATLTSMNNLAGTMWAQGDLAGARAMQEEVLEVRRRVQGAEHPDALTPMSNLAGTMWAQGDLAGARAMEEEVLPVMRRVLGAEHPDTLASMNNLAEAMRAQGDLAGARAMHEEVLAVRRRVLGAEHPDTLTSMNNLAGTMWAQGDLAGARAMQEEELAVTRRVLGAEHPDTLTSMSNLALTMRAQGDLAGARAMQEEELAVTRRVLGAEHPDTLTSMNNLALTMWAQGDLAGARAMEEEVLTVRRGVLGAEHPDTLTSMSNLALTMRAQGDLAGARAMQEEELAVTRRVLGAEHPATLTSMNNLASTMRAQGDLAGARAMHEEVLAVRRRVLGAEHPDTTVSGWNIVYTLVEMGERAEAERVAREHLAWLLEAEDGRLSGDQRKVREWVKETFGW